MRDPWTIYCKGLRDARCMNLKHQLARSNKFCTMVQKDQADLHLDLCIGVSVLHWGDERSADRYIVFDAVRYIAAGCVSVCNVDAH